MSDATLATLKKMIETLPESAQDRVVEHLREYIEDLRDEIRWDQQFAASQEKLARAARKARGDLAQGRSRPMDVEAL